MYAEGIPARLEEIVRKAPAKDPDERYQTARDLLLEQVTKGGGREAFESTDGGFVYYAKENVAGLWRVPVEGGEEVQVLDQVRQGA